MRFVFPLSTDSPCRGDRRYSSIAKIRLEALGHSQVMQMMHVLYDRYGPRVTGTPNHQRAARWAVDQMSRWGLQNGHLEPWNFGHAGWLNESATARIVAPIVAKVNFE